MSDITPVGEPTVFFVYGTLQPGELGYPVIAEEVSESVDAWVNGWCLWIRDGLPFIVPADPKDEHPMTVKGSLLVPKRGREGSLAESIRRFENRELYECNVVDVETKSGTVQAWVYRLRESGREDGYFLDQSQWSARYDPLFSGALAAFYSYVAPLIARNHRHPSHVEEYWTDAMFPLQGAYLVLCTILERTGLLIFNQTKGVTARITELDSYPAALAAVRQARPPQLYVWEAKESENLLSVWNQVRREPNHPFLAWYQVRSNLSHQGKEGGYESFDLLCRATAGLYDSLCQLLAVELPGIEDDWERRGFHRLEQKLSPLAVDVTDKPEHRYQPAL